MPLGVRIYNGNSEPCDALVGPCSCSAWHSLNGTIESCKQKGIYTKFLEDVFKQAIQENHERLASEASRCQKRR